MTLFLFSFNEIGNRVNKLAVIDCCQMINDQFACDIDFILEEKAPDKKVYLKLSAAKENLRIKHGHRYPVPCSAKWDGSSWVDSHVFVRRKQDTGPEEQMTYGALE